MEVKKLYVGTGWINVNMKLKLFLKTRENLRGHMEAMVA